MGKIVNNGGYVILIIETKIVLSAEKNSLPVMGLSKKEHYHIKYFEV